MKKNLACGLAVFGLSALNIDAAISVDIYAGAFRTSSSALVSETSLWAIVYDADGNGVLPGGLTASDSAVDNLGVSNSAQMWADFSGLSVQAGNFIGGDKILRVFEVNGLGTSGTAGLSVGSLTGFTYASEGVSGGGKWAIYWFPGLSTGNFSLPETLFEVGGIWEPNPGSGGDLGMKFPLLDSGGESYTAAFISTENSGGTIAPSSFNAVFIVPEPASLMLSALGFAALLRRRR